MNISIIIPFNINCANDYKVAVGMPKTIWSIYNETKEYYQIRSLYSKDWCMFSAIILTE